MAQDMDESTRVMGAASAPGAPPVDKTMVAGTPPFAPPAPGGATQMGTTVVCAVCRTNNSGLETYCSECGFLLASAPGSVEVVPSEETATHELVESTTGRRFRLTAGVNTIGRERCDILLMEGTVSRHHAQITIENGLVILMDLGSSNGTQVDGTRLSPNQPVPLADGATLRFGNALLSLVASATPAEATILSDPPPVAVQVDTPPDAVEQTLLAPEMPPSSAEAIREAEPTAAPPLSPPPVEVRSTVAQLTPTSAEADVIYIAPGKISIGRRTGNDIVISRDPYISGRHCEILCDNSGCYLIDVGSTNGTQVNGQRLAPHHPQLLLDGDEVSIGQTAYRFETLEPPEETAASHVEILPSESAVEPSHASSAVDSDSTHPSTEPPTAEGGPGAVSDPQAGGQAE